MVNPIAGIRGMLGQSAINDGVNNALQQAADISSQEHLKKNLKEQSLDTQRTKKALEDEKADLKKKEEENRDKKKRKKNPGRESDNSADEASKEDQITGRIIDIKA